VLIFAGVTRGRTEVLPTTVYLEFSVGNTEAAVAVSLLMVGIAVAVLVLLRAVGGRGAGP
jgi:molybdate transport system permease protein